MSENNHTPEPWAIDPDDRPNMHWNNHIVSEANPNIAICFMAHDGTEQNERGEANARRVVACVNACKGIPTYQLTGEDGNPVILGDMIDLLRNQRDTLLPICEELRESAEYWSEYDVPLGIVERLTAAIASVKGGA